MTSSNYHSITLRSLFTNTSGNANNIKPILPRIDDYKKLSDSKAKGREVIAPYPLPIRELECKNPSSNIYHVPPIKKYRYSCTDMQIVDFGFFLAPSFFAGPNGYN